jgi:hypothetical protein
MNLRTVASILVLFAMAWQSAGVETVYLGSGFSDNVISLSSVTKLSNQSLNFSSPGYVSPKRPQTMALSTSSMINQAKVILAEAKSARDETVAARDEARILRNETMIIYSETRKLLAEINKSKVVLAEINDSRELLAEINEKELSIQSMQEKIESEAAASAASAAQASSFLNKTDETYGEILRLSAEIEDNVEKIRSTIQGARNFANSSVVSTIQSLSDVLPVVKKS